MKNRRIDSAQIRNTLLLVLAAFIWGTAFVAQSVGAKYVGTFTFLAGRSWLGSIALVPVVVLSNMSKRRKSRDTEVSNKLFSKTLIYGGIACGFILCAASGMQQAGMGYTTTAKAGFITALYVLIVPILSIFMGKKVRIRIWICVLIGVIGLYLLCIAGTININRGDIYVLLCAFLFSLHILVVDYFSPRVDGIALSCIQFFVAAVISTILMFLYESPQIEDIRRAGFSIFYAGVFSSGIAFTLQIVGQKNLNPTVASLAMCLESVFSALAGWVILGESLNLREITGCLMMLGAIVIAELPDKAKVNK